MGLWPQPHGGAARVWDASEDGVRRDLETVTVSPVLVRLAAVPVDGPPFVASAESKTESVARMMRGLGGRTAVDQVAESAPARWRLHQPEGVEVHRVGGELVGLAAVAAHLEASGRDVAKV